VRWSACETVACAIANETAEHSALVYVVFDSEQVPSDTAELVGMLARQVGLAIRAARLQELARQQALLEQELATARRIQGGLVPRAEREFGPLRCHVHYDPCREVGGDYADVWQLDDGRVACIIADVCGKGLGAALVMTQLHAAIRVSFESSTDLAAVVGMTNRTLCDHTPINMFVTLAALLVDPESRKVETVIAGHPPPILVGADGSVRELACDGGMPVGVAHAPYTCQSHELGPGCSLWLYTDGIHETSSPSHELLGTDGVIEWLGASGHDRSLDAAKRVAGLVDHCRNWRAGRDAQDDQTIVLIDLPDEG
jgi:sigma-B regulation protein RsbU (phosphoserine phosphatase)